MVYSFLYQSAMAINRSFNKCNKLYVVFYIPFIYYLRCAKSKIRNTSIAIAIIVKSKSCYIGCNIQQMSGGIIYQNMHAFETPHMLLCDASSQISVNDLINTPSGCTYVICEINGHKCCTFSFYVMRNWHAKPFDKWSCQKYEKWIFPNFSNTIFSVLGNFVHDYYSYYYYTCIFLVTLQYSLSLIKKLILFLVYQIK